jgi:hypothetical protein
MPDPRVLYMVTAVVVLALVAWVVIVLARPDGKAKTSPEGKPAKSRSRLDSHLEIQDQSEGTDREA